MSLETFGTPNTIDGAEQPAMQKMIAERGFRLSKPEGGDEFPGSVAYDGLEALPNYKIRVDRAVMVCRLFLKGILIFDDFGNKHLARRAAQEQLREDVRNTLGDDKAEEYWNLRNNNLLRAGGLQQMMMSGFLDPFGNGLIGIETPQAQRTREIISRFPKIRKSVEGNRYEISGPEFQWMVDRIQNMADVKDDEIITESTPYRAMTDEEKMEIVRLLDGIARDFLRLVIRSDKQEKTSVPGDGLEPST